MAGSFMHVQMCVYGLSCCTSGHDIDTARYYYMGLWILCVSKLAKYPLICMADLAGDLRVWVCFDVRIHCHCQCQIARIRVDSEQRQRTGNSEHSEERRGPSASAQDHGHALGWGVVGVVLVHFAF